MLVGIGYRGIRGRESCVGNMEYGDGLWVREGEGKMNG